MISSEDKNDLPKLMRRIASIAPDVLTFEDGLYILQYLISSHVLKMESEAESPSPDQDVLDKQEDRVRTLLKERETLVSLWRRLTTEHQKELAEFSVLLTIGTENPQ